MLTWGNNPFRPTCPTCLPSVWPTTIRASCRAPWINSRGASRPAGRQLPTGQAFLRVSTQPRLYDQRQTTFTAYEHKTLFRIVSNYRLPTWGKCDLESNTSHLLRNVCSPPSHIPYSDVYVSVYIILSIFVKGLRSDTRLSVLAWDPNCYAGRGVHTLCSTVSGHTADTLGDHQLPSHNVGIILLFISSDQQALGMCPCAPTVLSPDTSADLSPRSHTSPCILNARRLQQQVDETMDASHHLISQASSTIHRPGKLCKPPPLCQANSARHILPTRQAQLATGQASSASHLLPPRQTQLGTSSLPGKLS